jgi:DnaK suppressor protein
VRERDLERFRKILRARQADLLKSANDGLRAGLARSWIDTLETGDEADEAQRDLMEDARASLSARDSKIAQQIEAALRRIEDGTYGECIDCGREIEIERLRAVPWAQRCIQDQQDHEREMREHPPRL